MVINMKKARRIICAILAVALLGSTAVFPTFADAKYVTEVTADGWTKVTNDNGVILGYTEGSGVTIIEDDGYAFKDLTGGWTMKKEPQHLSSC